MRWRVYRIGHEPGGVGWCYTTEEDARQFILGRRYLRIGHGGQIDSWAALRFNRRPPRNTYNCTHVLVIEETPL